MSTRWKHPNKFLNAKRMQKLPVLILFLQPDLRRTCTDHWPMCDGAMCFHLILWLRLCGMMEAAKCFDGDASTVSRLPVRASLVFTQILMLLVITNSAHCWMTVLGKGPNFDPNILIMKLRIWVSDGFCYHRCCLFPKTPHCRGAPSKKVWDCRIPGSVSNLLRKVEKGRKQISTARHLYSRFAIYLGFGILKSMMIELGWW